MSYSVKLFTNELMLNPADAREIFDAFFEDALPLLQDGKKAMQEGDRQLLSRKMHTLKGSALNLRMDELGKLAARAEKELSLSDSELAGILDAVQIELKEVERAVCAFYKEGQ